MRSQLYPANRVLVQVGQILIVDSVPTGEYPTAARLRDYVEANAIETRRPFQVGLARVETSAELFAVLAALRADVERTRRFPIVHIECHGTPGGLELASGEHVRWAALRPHFVELTVVARMNVLLVFACCFGAYFAGTVDAGDRASFGAVFGPNSPIRIVDVEDVFRAYYRTLLASGDAGAALEATRAAVPGWGYFYATAEGVFRQALVGYMRRESAEGLAPLEPRHIEAWRRTYFCLDLYPDLANRYAVTHEELVAAAARPGHAWE